MTTVLVLEKEELKLWIKEAMQECLINIPSSTVDPIDQEEKLLSRREIIKALNMKISLVTLHAWMKQGLPFYKQHGKTYFIKSEVLDYIKKRKSIDK